MTKSGIVVSTLMVTAFVVSAAQAQVTVEVSKITCEEFASYKVMDSGKGGLGPSIVGPLARAPHCSPTFGREPPAA